MNILLVYPEVPETFWSFKNALKFINKKASSQPLGLLTIASLLPREWNKRLVDLNCNKLTKIDLIWADFVFISAMTIQKESVYKLIKLCKESGKKIVAGGPLFTEEYEQFEEVDYFVLNEAEITLKPFLEDLKSGELKRVYSSDVFPDIKDSPTPMWELADLNNYATMNIQYSRGCPFSCDFCNITTLFGHVPRTKSAKQIIDELNSLYKLGWRKSIFFVDDNFIGNKQRLKKDLLPALKKWLKGKKGISFYTEVSINLADDEELIKMMVEAGFNKVFIGIETPEEMSLAECNKKHNMNRDMMGCVQFIQKSGLQVEAGFILGFDNDTQSTFQRLIDFIQKSGIVTAMVGILQAPTNTLLYKRLEQEGRIVSSISGDNVGGTTNIIPKMDLDTLLSGYKQVIKQLYLPKLYNKRVKTFFKGYKSPKIKLHSGFINFFKDIQAFARSIYLLGVLDKERSHYWGLFIWTVARKPKMLSLAITFAIYGYHFRTVFEQQLE